MLLHVPHASTYIPGPVRDQFLLSDQDLNHEAMVFADLYTDELFAAQHPALACVVDHSRLVVDVERFADDHNEPMSKKGLGVIYTVTSDLRALRAELPAVDRSALLIAFYHAHHRMLEKAVDQRLQRFDRCLIIDCHSFPDQPFAYEEPTSLPRPDICIGTDPFHTSTTLAQAARQAFLDRGYSVALDHPFSGSMVPSKHLSFDARVQSIMIEVNKRLYLEQQGPTKSAGFRATQAAIQSALVRIAETD